MLISNKFKFVIINIKKTGTHSYYSTLDKYADIKGVPNKHESNFYMHETAKVAKDKFRQRNLNWDDYYKFVTIRNPWERFISLYLWKKNNFREDLFDKHDFNSKKIIEVLIQGNHSQEEYFMQGDEMLVNQVAKIEQIASNFNLFCSNVGITPVPELEHRNKNKKYNYKDFYNQELIDMVYEKEKYVIENYGYQY